MECKCICILAPMGEHHLEGFIENTTYKYVFIKAIPFKIFNHYYRVYHTESYYETCSPTVFKKYFKIL